MRWTHAERGFIVLIVAALSGGCIHRRATVHPIPMATPAEIEISSAPVVSTPRGTEPKSPKLSCESRPWRQAANSAFKNHERWVFHVNWGLVRAGEAILAVDGIEQVRGRPAYHLSMDIRATGTAAQLHAFRDRTDTWLDQTSLTPVFIRHSVREVHYQADETIRLDQDCGHFHKHYERLDKNSPEERSGLLAADTLDIYSLLFYLRTMPLRLGQTVDVELFTGDKTVAVTAYVRAKETVKVRAGTFNCLVVEMAPKNKALASKVREVRWWLGDSPSHPPIRIQMDIGVGHITADLDQQN